MVVASSKLYLLSCRATANCIAMLITQHLGACRTFLPALLLSTPSHAWGRLLAGWGRDGLQNCQLQCCFSALLLANIAAGIPSSTVWFRMNELELSIWLLHQYLACLWYGFSVYEWLAAQVAMLSMCALVACFICFALC